MIRARVMAAPRIIETGIETARAIATLTPRDSLGTGRNASEDENGGGDACTSRVRALPVWGPEIPGGQGGELIHSGFRSQTIGNQYRNWRAGVIQDVTVTAGTTYQFTVYARGRASQDQYPALPIHLYILQA